MKLILTGVAGFIGHHVAIELMKLGHQVVGIDNLNDYYDVNLKKARLQKLEPYSKTFEFHQIDIADRPSLEKVFKSSQAELVCNLAAQAGVRYSLTNPHAYTEANLVGMMNILECSRQSKIRHLVYASSSSVYGLNNKLPFSVEDPVDHPASLYAATKRCNELLAHSYSHMFDLPTTGLRFFTVYGPWGRPDMALFLFTKAILSGEPIEVFNEGKMRRDFTYIDDIVQGVCAVILKTEPKTGTAESLKNPDRSSAAYRVYNLGNHKPENLLRYIELIEDAVGKKAIKKMMPMFRGDVQETYADISQSEKDLGFSPKTSIDVGIKKFVAWYREYYRV